MFLDFHVIFVYIWAFLSKLKPFIMIFSSELFPYWTGRCVQNNTENRSLRLLNHNIITSFWETFDPLNLNNKNSSASTVRWSRGRNNVGFFNESTLQNVIAYLSSLRSPWMIKTDVCDTTEELRNFTLHEFINQTLFSTGQVQTNKDCF